MPGDHVLPVDQIASWAHAQDIERLGFWEWEIGTDTVRWSSNMFALFDVDPEAVDEIDVGTFLHAVHPHHRERVRGHIEAARETGIFKPFEFRVPRADGSDAWFRSRGDVTLDDRGRPVRMTGTVQEVTERKRLEREAEEKTERLEEAQRIAGLGLITAYPDQTGDDWSPEVYRILGVEPGEVEPTLEGFLERVHPEDRETVLDHGRAALEEGRGARYTCRLVRPGGEVRDAEIHLRVEAPEDPDERTLYVTVQDITHRARLERALEERQERLEEAQRLGEIGHWNLDVATGQVSGSDEMYRLLGLDPDQAYDTERFFDLVHPEDREAARVARDQAIRTGQPTSAEFRVNRPDGETVWLESRLVPLEEDGEVARIHGTVQNVTDRKVLEAELREREQRLREAQEVAKVGAWEWDCTTDTLWLSEQQLRNLGLDPGLEEPTLEDFLGCVHPEDRERMRAGIEQALETGTYASQEFRVVHPDGTVRWIEDRGEVETVDGGPVRLHGTGQDVTERKQLVEQLEQAKREAEQADRAKSMFLANVSHEVRTPMTAILGLSDLLLARDLPEGVREDLETIHVSGRHLLSILDDILDLSKIEAGELEVFEEPFDLRGCVEGALEMLAHRAAVKDVDLVYRMAEGVPEAVVGDGDRLRQVLVNLVSNGVKFTDEGGVTVTVEEVPGDASRLSFEVEDTGIGISPEDQERLFEPFKQVDPSATRRHEGTGLGLAITKRLVELMGGSIEMDSTPGGGSTFTVQLPLEPAESAPERAWKAPPEAFRSVRVLVVDDNPTNRDVLERQLAGWEMPATTAATPDEALALLEGEAFGLVLTDFQMPDMDGIELARRIGERLADPPPILVLTSTPSRVDDPPPEHVMEVLDKPVLPAELFAAIGRALGAELEQSETKTSFDETVAERHPLDVLVVEDSETNRMVQARTLAHLGYDADLAGDGREALERFEAGERFDLVLMDVQMPEVDGLEATRRIRERLPEHEQPRIVALTAHASPEDRERCLEAGMDGYLSKPVDVQALVEALEAVGGPAV